MDLHHYPELKDLDIDIPSERLNRVVDFGPPLAYPLACSAYTVEKMSLWYTTKEDHFKAIALKANGQPQRRVEGNLYRMTDEEVIALDVKRQVGVEFQRKRMPVYVPYLDHRGQMATIYAYVYVGLNDAWLKQIEEDYEYQHTKNGVSVTEKIHFKLCDTYSDPNRILHNRFAFLPPLQEYNPVMTTISETMRKHVRRRNRSEIRRLYFDQISKRVHNFFGDI